MRGEAVASITKTKTKCGLTAYRVRYRDPDGRSRERWFDKKADADRYRASVGTELARGECVNPTLASVRLSEWAQQWLETKTHRKAKTVVGYKSLLTHQVLPTFGRVRLRNITPMMIRTWVAKLGRDLSPSRVRQAYQVLSAILRAAVEDGRLAKNPAVAARDALPKVAEREMRFLTHEQVDALSAAAGPQWAPLIRLMAYSGLRWGEAVGLRRGRCDLLACRIRVAEAVSEIGGAMRIDKSKSEHSVRWVTIPPFIAAELASVLSRSEDADEDSLVFADTRGTPIRHSNFTNRVWKPAKAAGGAPGDLRIHDLRHTAAAFMIEAGAPMEMVRRQLGHSSITVTQRCSHLFPDQMLDINNRIEARRAASLGVTAMSNVASIGGIREAV